jgi:transposase InsO family protein
LLVDRVLAGHRPGEVTKQLGVSRQTVYKWVRCYGAEGAVGLADRSSRPHTVARLTSAEQTAAIVAARVAQHAGPVRLASLLGLPASTIGAVIARAGLPRLADVDRLTGQLLRGRQHSDRRYEHPHAGDLLHVDVKKLGRVPDRGGWRVHGRREEVRGRGNGWDYVHVAVDDHSRLAYAEVLPDEKVATCAAFLHRAVAWLAGHGVTVARVLTDNAKSYRVGAAWITACTDLGIGRRFIQPGRPWTNGKAERFNRTLQTEWAYARPWTSNTDRTLALDSWVATTTLSAATPHSDVTHRSAG